ncbi:sigma 54-interacting transcriptional regulator [Bradyrhizobium sp. Ai1a-2]|uniref:sigma 54-interacting transcriptional regulator n=1 Tax=Bradyrhizobium sp. Ai1a-2 TaxID=196490 RepID=UPI000409EF26|nr:sigma 54-interacting transcriptional regulator [Bradyrhizobium sp. Ai1a-2]
MLDWLSDGGVATQSLDFAAPADDGIICFSHIDDELYELVREVSSNKAKRVLAVPIAGVQIDSAQAWQLRLAGASDVLLRSSGPEMAQTVKARFDRWHVVDELIQAPSVKKLVGESPAWQATLRQIVEVGRFTNAAVLLIGESGTGKEMVGRLVHELDPRASRNDLVTVDCSTLVPELSGSEFFGHERGAFTGAVGTRDGAFEEANGGTLFLDEVGELSPAMQAQLLRVVQEGTYKRVGSNTWRRSDFRLVSATNRDLLQSISNGQFRHDLYHRIGGWIFRLPPLRERHEDVLPLACHFLRALLPDLSVADFDPPVREYLLQRPYPGNVRDLRQLIVRICSRHVGPGPITIGDLPDDEHPTEIPSKDNWRLPEFERSIAHALSLGVGLKEISQAAADAATRIAVEKGNGSLRDAARRLGVTDRALQMRRAAKRHRNGDGGQLSE